MTNPNPTTTAPTTAPPTPVEVPHSYVLVKSQQVCDHCSTMHEASELYIKTHSAPRFQMGKKVSHLKPISKLEWRMAIEVQTRELRRIPFCHECSNTLSLGVKIETYPAPSAPPVPDSRVLGFTQSAKPALVRAAAESRKTPKVASLDDLEAMLKE